ncbi:hypothetical protein C9374_002477 [Naegleria lovaniensis]|uniref:Guanylate cyclase domain-containing protein n=1 Tax=Naegleria lovaniensis TaxID=51637 RepID=A0AA88GUV0_NAELO|nr:uncharacterized protein C9374_002477 [Naegleria lovaniensis]KAG2386733.1 hypothetical protein C9374_002477 [Naegleria lovaniensis]
MENLNNNNNYGTNCNSSIPQYSESSFTQHEDHFIQKQAHNKRSPRTQHTHDLSITTAIPSHHHDRVIIELTNDEQHSTSSKPEKPVENKKDLSSQNVSPCLTSNNTTSLLSSLSLKQLFGKPHPNLTVMNVLVVFFLVQSLITIGTTFVILFYEGSDIAKKAETVAHQDTFRTVIRNLHDFVIPAEIVTTSLHNNVLLAFIDPNSHNSWAQLMSMTSVYDRQMSSMYFGDLQNRVTVLRQRNGMMELLVPCKRSLTKIFPPEIVTKDFDLTLANSCPTSHLKYNLSSDGMIMISQGVGKVNLDVNVSTSIWYTNIADNVNATIPSIPTRSKYTVWSNVFMNKGALSIFASMLVVKGNEFVGVSALEYSLGDLQQLLCYLVEKGGGAILVLDRQNNILGACARLSHFSFYELSSTAIQKFPNDFSTSSLFMTVHELLVEHGLYGNQTVSFSDITNLEPQLNGMIEQAYYSISSFSMNNLVVNVIVITEHTDFLTLIINSRVSSVVILFLVVSLGIVLLIIVVKGITSPFQALSKTMENILLLDRSMSSPVKSDCMLSDVRRMQKQVELFRKVLFYFSLFCPEIIVKHILKGSNAAESDKDQLIPTKRQYMSVLVFELNGFWELEQHVGIDVFCRILNRIISEVTTSIHSNEGFVCDLSVKNSLKIHALWNDSTMQVENHEVRAAATSLEITSLIADKIELIQEEYSNCVNVELHYRSALAAGYIILASTGTTTSRISFSCFGETIALCSLLLEQCRKGEVLMDHNMFVKVSDMFLGQYRQTIKHDNREVDIYSLKKYMKESSAYEQHVSSKLLQLRSRRRELDISELPNDTLFKSLCKELQDLGHEVDTFN